MNKKKEKMLRTQRIEPQLRSNPVQAKTYVTNLKRINNMQFLTVDMLEYEIKGNYVALICGRERKRMF